MSNGKKSMCGKLVRVSELKASRVNDTYDSPNKDDYNEFASSQRDSMLEGSNFNGTIKKNLKSVTYRELREGKE